MRKILTILFSFFLSSSIFSQQALNTNGFSGSAGFGPATNGTLTTFNGTYIYTSTASSSGNSFFRFYGDGNPCGEWGPVSTSADQQISLATKTTLVNCGSNTKAFFINAPNTTNNYVFKLGGSGSYEGNIVIFEIQRAIQTISSVTRNPSTTNVPLTTPTTVTANLSGALSTGQAVWIRYSTDNFATSTVAKMSGSGTSYSSTIPANLGPAGTTVRYYTFTSGDVASIAPSDVDLFTINKDPSNGSFVLPIELTFLAANQINKSVAVNWSTATETENSYFKIEHSSDGEAFSSVGEIKGNGTSKNKHDYTFTDTQPVLGINYYRIVDVDYNGVKTTSKTVSVVYTNQNAGNVLNIAPNPTVSSLSLSYEAQTTENSLMNIYDFNGRLILSQAINLTNGSNNARIDVSNLLSGIYIVKINNEVQRFVKM